MAFVQRIANPAYYNEFDPGAAAWLRELMCAGLIADGEVDERSILDVSADDVRGFTQCHWFAGIGGWSYALRLAGWPDDRPVWSGSPPCQPFSTAGKQKGRDDARHLAPHFISLVGAARPGMLFGEQVASSDVFGKAAKRARGNFVAPPQWAWLDDLLNRLEAACYAVGASDFPSAGVGAPHIRQRTFFGAVSHEWLADCERDGQHGGRNIGPERRDEPAIGSGDAGGLADSDGAGRLSSPQPGIHRGQESAGSRHGEPERLGDAGGLVHSIGAGLEGHGGHGDGIREPGRLDQDAAGSVAAAGADGRMADTNGRDTRAERQQRGREQRQQPENGGSGRLADSAGCGWREERQDGRGGAVGDQAEGISAGSGAGGSDLRTGPLHGFWRDADWLFCRDGKWRPVEPAVLGLVDGIPGCVVPSGPFVPASYPLAQGGKDSRRVMRLRGYGNAINPHAAAEFIRAFAQAADDICRPEPDATDLPVAFADLL